MKERQRVSATVEIACEPKVAYDLITDLPRMGEWSPENTGGSWQGGATGAAVGAKFKGKNKNGKKSWSGGVVVIEATAPKRFAFRTVAGKLTFAEWIYEIEPSGVGCTVTETWVDGRHPAMAKLLGPLITGVKDRAAFTQTSIETTLANLKQAAEG